MTKKTTAERQAASHADRNNEQVGIAKATVWLAESSRTYNECDARLDVLQDERDNSTVRNPNRRSQIRGEMNVIRDHMEKIIAEKTRQIAIDLARAD